MRHEAFWSALEYTCRLLGITTAAGFSVGLAKDFDAMATTLLEYSWHSYLILLLPYSYVWGAAELVDMERNRPESSQEMLGESMIQPSPSSLTAPPFSFSGVAVTVCEGFFFISLFLDTCFTHEPDSMAHGCWKQARRPGSFQKFLGYTLLSVACFLHPVMVWHVTIPGSMLVFTALAYFLLSKRRKTPGHKETHPEAGQYVDPSATTAAPTIAGDTEQTYTFHEAQREQHCSLLGHMKSILKGSKDRSLTPAATLQSEVPPAPRKQVHFQEKVVQIIPSVSESLDDVESETEETTSDTAPILTPPDTPVVLTPLSPTGLF
ncbi:hypothetical protein ASZ78_004093 [Callipepla squamata]|uniref:Transmembrane protein 72 n=1 Tax=Callipepla squamata TaxID=9009 RepID=A0A226MH23_CALSU|nr:hypothetical protein ASZ78_004093 [Callipepla squamata]